MLDPEHINQAIFRARYGDERDERRLARVEQRGATEAANEGWTPEANAASQVRAEAFDPIAMIDRLVQVAVAQRAVST